jgi:hypothetical protein
MRTAALQGQGQMQGHLRHADAGPFSSKKMDKTLRRILGRKVKWLGWGRAASMDRRVACHRCDPHFLRRKWSKFFEEFCITALSSRHRR